MKFPREDSLSLLHPKAREAFEILNQNLIRAYQSGELHCPIKVFETVRSPMRQEGLKAGGRSKASAWQSAHQYGLAVDFVPFVDKYETTRGTVNGWFWEVPTDTWDHLTRAAEEVGLFQSIKWDRAHIVHPLWYKIKRFVL